MDEGGEGKEERRGWKTFYALRRRGKDRRGVAIKERERNIKLKTKIAKREGGRRGGRPLGGEKGQRKLMTTSLRERENRGKRNWSWKGKTNCKTHTVSKKSLKKKKALKK